MIAQVRPADFAAWLASVAQSHPLDAPVLLDVREPLIFDIILNPVRGGVGTRVEVVTLDGNR